jgi:uncharacterized protein (DUF1778 family)
MKSTARLDLKLDDSEKDFVSRAAALAGTSLSAFVRSAAKEKAQAILDEQSKISLSTRDFDAFSQAINNAFNPNPALTEAMELAKGIKRA